MSFSGSQAKASLGASADLFLPPNCHELKSSRHQQDTSNMSILSDQQRRRSGTGCFHILLVFSSLDPDTEQSRQLGSSSRPALVPILQDMRHNCRWARRLEIGNNQKDTQRT